MNLKNTDIDLVVTWVDGSDIEHIKLKNKYSLLVKNKVSEEADNIGRFKDNGELKYLLRSVEQNAKFIRYIFLVTNGQVPKWLNIKHPKIKIITHDKIMPKNVLPTFNSNAIEACIVNIPGLSDRFLYANDDNFILKPISKNFFFNKMGYPIVRLKPMFNTEQIDNLNLYGRQIVFTVNLFNNKFNKKLYLTEHHNFDAFYKPDVVNCLKEFKECFDRTIQCKFREDKTIVKVIWSLYSSYIGHSTIKGYYFTKVVNVIYLIIKKVKNKLIKKNKKINDLKNNKEQIVVNYSVFAKIKDLIYKFILESTLISNTEKSYNIKYTKLFCINDNEFATDEDRKKSIEFLNKLYPNKSDFEI